MFLVLRIYSFSSKLEVIYFGWWILEVAFQYLRSGSPDMKKIILLITFVKIND